ncbi:4'-phosphopantetheinyl transferase superfamily protein [Kitasatospora griseola]|uniref:4'-phosphopantetheinyl transferase superfamily protein n=1 Tax=Kitasatospora griseola TaxID=2064 RepID=UPI003417FDF3
MTQRERDDLAADPPSIRSARALQLWVRKEAYSKAVGDGTGLDFGGLQVSPRAPAQHRAARAPGHPALNVFDQQVPGLATVLATAQASPVVALHRFDWTSALASGQDKE